MDQEKIEKIQNFLTPKNLKELQSFLGLCNYYRKFQNKYSELTAQFGKILSSKSNWCWDNDKQSLFEEIKAKFLDSVMLHHPNWNKPFYIGTDASDISVAAILYQINEKGDQEVISFASRTLLANERNFTITEKELLAVVFASKKFR